MSYNIGPKIGIDGEKEFRDQIRKINDTYKALEAETRAVTAAFDAQGDEQGKLEATSKQLQKQIDMQKEKQALLENAVQKATDKFGEESIEATRLRGALFDTQSTVSKLEAELKDTTARLNDTGDAMEDLTEEIEDAGDATLDFGDVLKANLASDAILDVLRDVGEAVKDLAGDAIEAAADIRAESSQFEQAFGDMADAAEDSLETISEDTGIAATRMEGSFTRINAFAKTTGDDSTEALNKASRAMVAAADNAAYYDKSIEEATEQLQSFLKGNYANDAALGITATETTRNAKANELYAKSFQELSESQKVDVLLSMVEAGNAASGALGSAAREAGEWTNVNGELAESWRQFLGVIGDPLLDSVIPLVRRATDAFNQMAETLSTVSAPEALAASMEEFEGTVAAANARFEEAEKSTAAAAYEAEYYTGCLAELEEAGLDTAEAQREYQLIVEKLNELIPDLNLTIDEQTGLLSKNTDAILADIQAWKDSATTKALHEKFSDVLTAEAAANAELISAKAQLSLLEKEEKLLIEQQTAANNALNEALAEQVAIQAELDSQLYTTSEEYVAAASRLDEVNARVQSLTQEAQDLATAVDDNFYAQQSLNREVKKAEEKLASYADDIEVAEEAVRGYSNATSDASNATDDQTLSVAAAESAVAELSQEYMSAKAAALDSINTQIGLFDELAMESDYTAAKIIENWEAQQLAFANYEDNLQKAVDLGLDETLVQQLSDGSQQSMQILDALVNDTEISVDEINAAFGGLSAGKDSLAGTLAEMNTIATEAWDDLAASAEQSSANVINGLLLGLNNRMQAFEASMADVGRSGIASFNRVMGINSPADKMIPGGEFTVDGAIVGVENRMDAFSDVMSDLALAGENSFMNAQLDRVAAYPGAVQAPVSNTHSVAYNYGGITIPIYQQPGESGEDLAYRVMEIIQQEVEAKEAGIGG